ncbi:hypothetical protein OS493_003044 [Desmophyllum pertusum]|uniref:Myosin motor domain-containing protein n=1 Tax=Desmophyllum pertusum TaxID=174260 RepID=A0A9X0CGD4_9CNID|nr:hypothetical protein OS493_003044 [Desmophyllum pertusum]
MEQDEYASENIRWADVPFFDNQPRLDLLAKPPYGLIHILADATGFPKADDLSFLDKCHHHHGHNKFYANQKHQNQNLLFATMLAQSVTRQQVFWKRTEMVLNQTLKTLSLVVEINLFRRFSQSSKVRNFQLRA